MDRNQIILIITNKSGVALAKKIAKKLPTHTQIIATDAIISDLLSQNKINNFNAYDLIGQAREKELYRQAAKEIFSENLKNELSPDLKEFFNCFRAQFLYPLIELRFYDLYFKELLKILEPKKIYFFAYTDWPNRILQEILVKDNREFELFPISFFGKLKFFALSYPPFIGREKKYYEDLLARFKLFNCLKSILNKNKINRQKDYSAADILVGTFTYRSQIKEFAPLLKQLKDKNYPLLALIGSELSLKDCSPLIKSKIACRFINTSGELAAKNQPISFNLFPDSPSLKARSEKFNWSKKYLIYQKFNSEIDKILAKAKPHLVLGIDQFYWPTRILINRARASGLETILLASINNQIHQFDLAFLTGQDNGLLFCADKIIALNETVAALYQGRPRQLTKDKVHLAGSLKFNDWLK